MSRLVRHLSQVRLVASFLLLALFAVRLVLASTPSASAESVTVSGTVNEISSVSLSANAVTMAAGNPGETKTAENAITVTIQRNGAGAWQMQTRALTATLTNGTSTISIGNLKWKSDSMTDYSSFDTAMSTIVTGNGPTSASGQTIQLSFSLAYPATATPGSYSVQIELVVI